MYLPPRERVGFIESCCDSIIRCAALAPINGPSRALGAPPMIQQWCVRQASLVVLWAFAALRVISCFFRAWHDENELRGEAQLLLRQVCDIPRHHAVGSSLIRCDEARSVLGGGPLPLVVAERALSYLILGTLSAARREVGAFLQTVGMLGAIGLAVVFTVRSVLMKRSLRRWEKEQREATSEMYRARTTAIVPLRFTEEEEELSLIHI